MTAPEPMDLVFGLVETSAGGDGSAAFGELAAWLREHDGVSIERKCCTSYRALAESVRAGESDIAWLPPVAYAWLAIGPGATPSSDPATYDTVAWNLARGAGFFYETLDYQANGIRLIENTPEEIRDLAIEMA